MAGALIVLAILAVLVACFLLHVRLCRQILADLDIEESVLTGLPPDRVHDLVVRAMRDPSLVLSHRVERQFVYTTRQHPADIVLAATISDPDADGLVQVDVGVSHRTVPTLLGQPSFSATFRRPARVRRAVVNTLLAADPDARTAADIGEWEIVG